MSRRARVNATQPDASVPAVAAIPGASSLAPQTRAITSAAAVPRLSVRPREKMSWCMTDIPRETALLTR